VRELRPGLWHWQAPHPEWESTEPWDQYVSSYAIDDGERLLLFDPLGVPSELEALAAERETAIVLTAPWHEPTRRAWLSGSARRSTRRCPTARRQWSNRRASSNWMQAFRP
jgi:hypothetical protein